MSISPLTIIVKTSFACNMRCVYCYEGHRSKQKPLSIKTVDNLISKLAHYSAETRTPIVFIWHGGEPLLMGTGFFEHVVQAQRSHGSTFRYQNLIQTNGVLLDDEFANFCVKNDFHVGISLDGPPAIHDSQRFLHSGAPSFDRVYSALLRMQSHDQRIGLMAIFTRNTLNDIDSFYEFFRDRSLNLRINPLLVLGRATEDGAKDLRVSPAEYGKALIYIFDRWLSEPVYSFSVEPFGYILRSLVAGKPRCCGFAGRCQDYFKMDPNGNIRPCGRRDDDTYVLGNINTDDISTIVNSPNRQLFALDRSRVREHCGECRHYAICHGGCTTSAYMARQNMADPDFYCESYMVLFDHIKSVVPKMIASRKSSELTHLEMSIS